MPLLNRPQAHRLRLLLKSTGPLSFNPKGRKRASGRLSPTGPGVFGPTHGSAADIAGQGVANPSGILLATALMLGEGLGQRAAAQTLERAISGTIAAGVRTADLGGSGVAASTRDFMDAVIDLMPESRTDVEFLPNPA